MSRWSLVLVVSSLSFSAFAEEESGSLDVRMNVRLPGSQPAKVARSGSPAAVAQGDVSVECAPMNGVRPSVIKFLAPEGARAQVFAEDGSLEGEFSVPFNFQGRGDTFYRFVLGGPDGTVLLDRKIEAKQYLGCTAKLRGGQAVAPAAAPAAGMPAEDFQALLGAIEAEGFSEGKLRVLATAAQSAAFSVSQTGQLVDAFNFSADKLKALELVRGRIVDRSNNYRLLEHFTFSADKAKAQALLR